MIKAIETKYKGYRFRSRLEARWAVFFDALGVEWEYEKEGYDLGETGWYLPDFFVTWPNVGSCEPVSYWCEIKPSNFSIEERLKCALLAKHTGYACIMLQGVPDFRNYDVVSWIDDEDCEIVNPIVIWSSHQRPWWVFEDDDMLELNDKQYTQAYAAARAARFEHGETP